MSNTTTTTNTTAVSSQAFHVDSQQLETSAVFNAVLGALFVTLFVVARGALRGCGGVYIRRLELPHLLWRPYTMALNTVRQIWNWVPPLLATRDIELMRSSGLDALMLQRATTMGVQMFWPLALFGVAALLPVLINGAAAAPGGTASQGGAVTSSTQAMCMANLENGAAILWLFWAAEVCYIAWGCWVLRWHVKSYQELRLAHLECLDMRQLPGDSLADRPTPSVSDPATRGRMLQLLYSHFLPSVMHAQDLEAISELRAHGKPVTREQMTVGAAAAATVGVCTVKGGLSVTQDELAALLPAPAPAAPRRLDGAGRLGMLDDALGEGASGGDEACREEAPPPSTLQLVEDTGHLAVLRYWDSETELKGPAAAYPNLGTPPVTLAPSGGRWRSVVDVGAPDGGPFYVNIEQYAIIITNIVHSPSHDTHMHSPMEALLHPRTIARALPTPSPTRGGRYSRLGTPLPPSPTPSGGSSHHSRSQTPTPTPVTVAVPPPPSTAATVEEGGLGAEVADGPGGGMRQSMADKVLAAAAVQNEPTLAEVQVKLQAMLSNLYPDTLLHIIPVVSSKEVEKLLQEWDHAVAALGGAVYAARASSGAIAKGHFKASGVAPQCDDKADPGGDAVAAHVARLQQLQDEVLEARRRALLNPPGSSFIAVFSSQRAACEASTVLLQSGSDTGMYLSVLPSPAPSDLNHPALSTHLAASTLRKVAAFPLAVFMVLFPIGVLAGILTNLSEILCGLDTDNDFVVWWCTDDAGWANLVRGLITGVLPSIISAAWDTYVLPLWFYACVQFGRSAPSLGAVDIAIMALFVQNNYWNVFLQPVLSTLGLTQIGPLLQGGGWWQLLGTSLPSSYTFFLQLLLARALFTNLMRLFWPHDGSILFVALRAMGVAVPRSPRDEAIIHSPPSTRSARHVSAFHLSFLIGLAYAVIAPLVALAAWAYFVTATLTWRYVLLYVYERNKETGGSLFLQLYGGCITNLYLSIVMVASVLLTKASWYSGGSLLLLLPPCVYMFDRWCRRIHLERAEKQPLMRSAASPSLASVDVQAFLPAAIRNGAAGWWEEEGKVWCKYGIPKWV